MSLSRRGSYALLILALLGLAGWGLFQTIGAQDEVVDPQPLTLDEQNALFDEAVAKARRAAEDFVSSGGDPCSLVAAESPGHKTPRYQDMESLINDVDLIVEGDVGANSILMPRPNTAAARIRTEFSVGQVLLGSTTAQTIVIETGASVIQNGGELLRVGNPSFDPCFAGHAVVFLDETEEGVYWLASQGFVTFSGDMTDGSRSSDLFAPDVKLDDLKADIRRIASEQQARGVPKGRLICDSRRDSESFQDPKACPGDSFNPHAAFGLARVLEIDIQKLGADGQVIASRADVPPDIPAVIAMLALLDRTVAVQPGDGPQGDVVFLKVITTTTGTLPYVAALTYDAATDSIWASGGWFPAPEGFGAALNAILEGS